LLKDLSPSLLFQVVFVFIVYNRTSIIMASGTYHITPFSP
jgi:hypothetical protein